MLYCIRGTYDVEGEDYTSSFGFATYAQGVDYIVKLYNDEQRVYNIRAQVCDLEDKRGWYDINQSDMYQMGWLVVGCGATGVAEIITCYKKEELK